MIFGAKNRRIAELTGLYQHAVDRCAELERENNEHVCGLARLARQNDDLRTSHTTVSAVHAGMLRTARDTIRALEQRLADLQTANEDLTRQLAHHPTADRALVDREEATA